MKSTEQKKMSDRHIHVIFSHAFIHQESPNQTSRLLTHTTPTGMATIKTQAHFRKDMGQAEPRHDGGRHKGDHRQALYIQAVS